MQAPPNAHDISQTILPYLDKHLALPILNFLLAKQIYPKEQLLQAKLDLLSLTQLTPQYEATLKELHPEAPIPPDFIAARDEHARQLEALDIKLADFKPLFAQEVSETKVSELANEKGLSDTIVALFEYAKLQSQMGEYKSAAEYLARVLSLCGDSHELRTPALWGKLSSEICASDWEKALAALNLLKDAIVEKDKENVRDKEKQSTQYVLQQRTWLLHWALFVFFNHPNGRNLLVDMFLQERFLNIIQTLCPHLVRYLVAAVVCNKRRRTALFKDTVRVLQQESHRCRDPITEFVLSLFVEFDFDTAQKKLQQCEAVLNNDFFLMGTREDFMENGRQYIFEIYCKIHQTIEVESISKKLGMAPEQAEQWLVNLIRNARLDAKIQCDPQVVTMNVHTPSLHRQIMDKTKGLSFRSALLASNLEKKVLEKAK